MKVAAPAAAVETTPIGEWEALMSRRRSEQAEPRRSRLRCAIYTRKSSEEGLEQDFNSLDAQREACEAYIASQKHEGWGALPNLYDDGGYSGGTIERPALQQLLTDIAGGKIDVVVVYKIDRLTRSLLDFAKIVEIFEKRNVSFVSVTQQFNTTTSMGRLTLNVLLSFAQFEREVTGERIRDKVAASKRKGMWMGGHVPIGYDAHDRTLVINEPEAATVRAIFDLYLEHGTVPALQAEVARRGLITRRRTTGAGGSGGGRTFSRGHLYKLLTNPLYIGEIDHKGERHRGQHPAIIDRATWDAVQAQLRANTHGKRRRTNSKEPSLLSGLLFDEVGHRLSATHAVKNGRRYRYYAGSPERESKAGQKPVIRISAPEIEPAVIRQVTAFLGQTTRLIDELDLLELAPDGLTRMMASAQQLATDLDHGRGEEQREILVDLVGRIVVGSASLRIELKRATLAARLVGEAAPTTDHEDEPVVIEPPIRIARRGVETRLVIDGPGGGTADRTADPALVKAVARGHVWFEELTSGQAASISEIARREGVSDRFVSILLNLAFLAPSVVQAIMEGRQPAELTAKGLMFGEEIRPLWREQMRLVPN